MSASASSATAIAAASIVVALAVSPITGPARAAGPNPGSAARSPAPDAASPALPDIAEPDDARFREGLRSRGLDDWLTFELQDTPPPDEVDAALRRRESLLADAVSPGSTTRQHEERIKAASEVLRELLRDHPDHPARLHWRLDLAEDLLYRGDPALFRELVLFDLPGRDRTRAEQVAAEALKELDEFTRIVASTWKHIEGLNETALDALHDSPTMSTLERLAARARDLEVWTRLYQAFAAPTAESRHGLAGALLDDLNGRYGYLQPSPGQPLRQIAGLTVAATAARLAGKPDRAADHARRAVAAMASPDAPPLRERDLAMALLAVLEQIRGLRDLGRIDEALAALKQVRAWVDAEVPGDAEPLIAVVLLEHDLRIMAAGAPAGGTGRPRSTARAIPEGGERLLMPPLEPLLNIARERPSLADALYATLATALADVGLPKESDAEPLLLLLGAALHDARPGSDAAPDLARARLALRAAAIRNLLAKAGEAPPAEAASAWAWGELRFLLAGAEVRLGNPVDGIELYISVPTAMPQHPRAADAVGQAVRRSRELLGENPARAGRATLLAYARAHRLLLTPAAEGFPPETRQVRYAIGLALEHAGSLEEAAGEYAAIPATDPDGVKAMVGALRCQRGMLRELLISGNASEGKIREQADRAIASAGAAVKMLGRPPQGESLDASSRLCAQAEATLVLANLLNLPSVSRHEDAIKALRDFETRFADCPALIGPALRERILAMREAHRLGEAREVVEQFLQRRPPDAGPVMIALLEAMREEIGRADARGDQPAAANIAAEAAKLAATLLTWADAESDGLSDENLLTLRVLEAWSLLRSGDAAAALPRFQAAAPAVADLPESSPLPLEVELGMAEALVATGQASEALPRFGAVWQRLTEDTDYWWRAYTGSLAAHTAAGSDPGEILSSIRQQRGLTPDLGGARWRGELDRIEAENQRKLGAPPTP